MITVRLKAVEYLLPASSMTVGEVLDIGEIKVIDDELEPINPSAQMNGNLPKFARCRRNQNIVREIYFIDDLVLELIEDDLCDRFGEMLCHHKFML